MRHPLLALCLAPLLLSCASNSAPLMRFVDCTRTAYCAPLAEWPNPSPVEKIDVLYARGVRSILREMACGKMVARGRRLAYVSERDLAVPCGSAPIRHVRDRDHGNRLLAAGDIDYVVEFERATPSKVSGGIDMSVSAVFYGKAGRRGADSRLEGMDNYLIVQTKAMTELRLISQTMHD